MYTEIRNSISESISRTAVNTYNSSKKTYEKKDEAIPQKANRDYFEYIAPDETSSSAMRAASATNTATNDSQRQRIAYMLAAKRAGLNCTSTGSPIINSASESTAFQSELNKIKTSNYSISYKRDYFYSQTGNDYGYTNATSSCATYALATALSIKENRSITPDIINTNSPTDGHGTKWGNHGAYSYAASETETLLAIDAQLALGNPVLIHATGKDSGGNDSEHWATVIGKANGVYTIVDPYYGDIRSLSNMQIYKNGGSIVGYAIISDKY